MVSMVMEQMGDPMLHVCERCADVNVGEIRPDAVEKVSDFLEKTFHGA